MLPASGAGPGTGQTGVGLPTSARAPADVAPSATVFGLGRFVDVAAAPDCLGGVLGCVAEVAGLAALLELSWAKDAADAVAFRVAKSSAAKALLGKDGVGNRFVAVRDARESEI